jgi:hypothetical protein
VTRSPPLAVVSCDTAGPIRPHSADGTVHFGTLVDTATRFTVGKALPQKCGAAQFVHNGLRRLQIITGRTVGRYHSDGPKELMMPTLVNFLREQDRDHNDDRTLTVQQPGSRRQEPCYLQRGAGGADIEWDLSPQLDVRCRRCCQQSEFHPAATAGRTVSPAHPRAWCTRLADNTNAPPAIRPAWVSHRHSGNEAQARAP